MEDVLFGGAMFVANGAFGRAKCMPPRIALASAAAVAAPRIATLGSESLELDASRADSEPF
jgi:hypothetical protein